MPRPSAAALLHAAVLGTALVGAVCAHAWTAPAFEVVPRPAAQHRPHRAAFACAVAGAGLIAASFPLADAADRDYARYLHETHPEAIESRWSATVRADRRASAALLAGETLLATAAYLRFVRPARESRVSLHVSPARCAVACSF